MPQGVPHTRHRGATHNYNTSPENRCIMAREEKGEEGAGEPVGDAITLEAVLPCAPGTVSLSWAAVRRTRSTFLHTFLDVSEDEERDGTGGLCVVPVYLTIHVVRVITCMLPPTCEQWLQLHRSGDAAAHTLQQDILRRLGDAVPIHDGAQRAWYRLHDTLDAVPSPAAHADAVRLYHLMDGAAYLQMNSVWWCLFAWFRPLWLDALAAAGDMYRALQTLFRVPPEDRMTDRMLAVWYHHPPESELLWSAKTMREARGHGLLSLRPLPADVHCGAPPPRDHAATILSCRLRAARREKHPQQKDLFGAD